MTVLNAALLAGYVEANLHQDREPMEQKAFTLEETKKTYYMAYQLYQKQHYREAVHFFRYLTLIDATETKYWIGLGASLQMQKEYQRALESYVCAQALHGDQPDPYLYLHAADCYFALNQIEQGLKALEGAKESAKKKNNKQVLNHVDLMTKVWNQR